MTSFGESNKIISTEYLISVVSQLKNGDSFPLVVTGHSMLPFLKAKRDTVFLSRFEGCVKKGDILMYNTGTRLILHRVKKTTVQGVFFVGDAYSRIEGPVPVNCIIAECNTVLKNGKKLNKRSLQWQFYSKIWINILYLRSPLLKLYNITKH